ncbi:PREDICTED: uncharacterized protein LOC105571025 [Vollenhovia emeryi]|uniref:uncharacterized protein LOC105571025 n=1 Tax=Vollenhovia emeryi TaxID=411798 RepID=UPI0005F50F15|nr:PREDICTED: uncharacterized protein LOC105571025 [Vollenhovia emeryi]
MGKSSHKSKKRKRSSSGDKLAGIEERLTLLINLLSDREVGAPGVSFYCPSSIPANHDDLASGSEICSGDLSNEEVSEMTPFSNGGTLATPARQDRPSDPHVSVPDMDHSGKAPPSPSSLDIQVTVVNPRASDETDLLSRELFGAELESSETIAWNDRVSQKWRDLVRSGLVEGQRTILIDKYSPSNEMDFLRAPELNAECKSALKSNSVVKRDEHSCASQNQVGVALFALGEAISDFLKPETQNSLSPEARLAVSKVNDGAKILADLFYRLSLSRRAQIKSTFNLLAKTTAEVIPADKLLFGSSFGEEIKKATTMEKSAKDITRATLTLSKRIQQPIKQSQTSDKEVRGVEPQSPVAESLQVPFEETIEDFQVPIAGRLSLFLTKWREISSDPVVLQAVSGYRLPFRSCPPPQTFEPLIHLSKPEEENCYREINSPRSRGAIETVADCEGQFLSSFFIIKKASGGCRFILNLKTLNKYVLAPHFKLEDWRTVTRLLSPNDFMASIDLQDAYLLVPIFQDDRKFLRFRFHGQLFQFRALPFGLASAP